MPCGAAALRARYFGGRSRRVHQPEFSPVSWGRELSRSTHCNHGHTHLGAARRLLRALGNRCYLGRARQTPAECPDLTRLSSGRTPRWKLSFMSGCPTHGIFWLPGLRAPSRIARRRMASAARRGRSRGRGEAHQNPTFKAPSLNDAAAFGRAGVTLLVGLTGPAHATARIVGAPCGRRGWEPGRQALLPLESITFALFCGDVRRAQHKSG